MGAALKKRRTIIGSKGGSATQKQPSIATNSVPSLATARIVYLWSWGPIVGPVNGLKSIKLDGTQVQADDGTLNFPNVKWQFRSGELNQARLEGIAEASNEITVNQQLISTTPWLYSVTNPSLNAVRVRFGWPQLQSQDSSGNINGVRIEYAIDVSTDSGPFTTVLTSFVDRKNVTKYERSHRIELPSGGRWSVRVRRLTAEANSSLVQDGMLIEAIAEVVDSDQEYPLTAVSALEYDAQQFGGDIAKVAVLMRGRIVRVPANYDAATRTYSTGGSGTTNGIWDGTFKEAYTNNPAWVFYDLVLHPYYGLGERIDATMVDRFALYRIAQYCDQMVSDGNGGMEPRFACNLYLQKQEEAYAVLQDLASIFHGLAFWDGSQIVVNADMPGDPVYTYNPSQILNDGAIQYSGTRWRDRHTLAMVSWDNPALGFDTDKEPVFDEDAMAEIGSVRDLSVAAFGCTTQGQAQRAGMWALMTEQLQTRGGKFAVGLDGQIPRPGQVIAVADPMFAGRDNGGRISAVAGRAITLDREVTLPSGARLLCNLPSGKSEARVVKSVAGRVVTVMADYSEVPQAESGWAMDYDDLKLMQFYVRNITRPEWHQYQFELIQHEPSKFDAIDSGAVIDTRPISVLPIGVQAAPATVIIGQHVVIEQGIAVTVMTIAWESAAGAVGYDVEWRWGAREWIKVPRTGELSVDVRGIYSGQYLARVRAVNSMGVSSLPTSSTLTQLNGKNGLPPAVTFLTATSLLFGIGLKWGFPAGAEDTQRTEIWYGPTTDLAAATKLADLAYPQSDHSMQSLLADASFFFWARLVDRTGNIGPWYPVGSGVLGQASAEAGPILDLIAGQISETELGQHLQDRIDLIDGNGPGSVNERIGELQNEIGGIVDALVYVPTDAYVRDNTVRVGDNLWNAIINVPAAADGSNGPPNATYWINGGQSSRTANALAAQVTKNTTDISTVDGNTTANAQQIASVKTTVNDPVTGVNASASGLSSLKGTVTTLDGRVTAQATRIDGVYAQVNPALAGDDAGLAGSDQSLVGVWSEQSARIEDGVATGQRIDTVQVQVGQANATVQQVSQAQATADGKASAMWAVKLQVNAQGQYVAAGIGLGIENIGGVFQSQFIVSADRFALVNSMADGTTSVPFAAQGGQLFLGPTFIQDGTITNAKIGSYISSTNYIAGQQGWILNKDGTLEINGVVAGGGKLVITNRSIRVYDASSVKRVQLGDLSE